MLGLPSTRFESVFGKIISVFILEKGFVRLNERWLKDPITGVLLPVTTIVDTDELVTTWVFLTSLGGVLDLL